ncbi:DUF1585 domain-containing protein [Sorangium sp. So ce131]|uniref:DUF1585 domain-containing protein n=1 Tax=Sorangium sp. So ce131 TaxID=3133282 RepID=UPI003F6395A6
MRRASRTAALLLPVALLGRSAAAAPSLGDYRYFRALSIDLQGRMPTREEIAALESPGFDLDAWIDARLDQRAYAERIRRIYMDLLRLDVGPSFQFVPKASLLRRHEILGPDGKPMFVYFRLLQRRQRPETDGDFCFTKAETGLQFPKYANGVGTAVPVSQEVLDRNTVLVRPWWLYRDYRSPEPIDRYDPAAWSRLYPNFTPTNELLFEPDGTTPVEAVRVCREEAQTALRGTVFVTGRRPQPLGTPPPYDRILPLPYDTEYARAHPNEPIDCLSGTSVTLAHECGCGPGLERCLPTAGPFLERRGFTVPLAAPIGAERPTVVDPEFTGAWSRFWWGQEAVQFLERVVAEDRDFREVLTAKYTYVNGPLSQFYQWIAPSTCCGGEFGSADYLSGQLFGYVNPVSLFEPDRAPRDLLPHDTATWVKVEDRGPLASGLMTMPIFLTKYGSRRGRAHALYNVFLCSEFVSTETKLPPSNESNLMIRPGCSGCHVSLEPLAAYFSRVVESDWTFLPGARFPLESDKCGAPAGGAAQRGCDNFYDPAFTSQTSASLRGAYGSHEHAEEGPAGLGRHIVSSERFAPCVAEKVTSSFLGRPVTGDDAALLAQVEQAFVGGDYHMKPLVRALVRAAAYKDANNLAPAAWRNGGAQ